MSELTLRIVATAEAEVTKAPQTPGTEPDNHEEE